jgi:hypothetical protein
LKTAPLRTPNEYRLGVVVIERIGVGEHARQAKSHIVYQVGDKVGTVSGEYDAITGMGTTNDVASGVYSSIRIDRPKAAPAGPPAAEMLENGGMS